MFVIAVFIGIYSYLIFLLGIYHMLDKQPVILMSLLFILFVFIYTYRIIGIYRINLKFKKLNRFSIILILLILAQIVVNLMGALGYELSFDALWYHLTLPKLYILNKSIFHIPGGLLYYSDMPKLTEMLYTAGLLFGDETLPKLIHFSFGILSSLALYKISRKFVSKILAILAALIFYSSLVIGWQSITAYIDLSRTFFETMALWGFLNFIEKKEKKWLIGSSVMLGLAISTKLISLSSLFIFTLLIFYFILKGKGSLRVLITIILTYWFFSVIIPLPWFVFSWINTGSPVYPVFSGLYPVNVSFGAINPINFIKDVSGLFTKAVDPISPIYLITAPFILIYFRKFSLQERVVAIYSLLAVVVWYFTPRTGGGRFILPYLPAFSILTIILISKIKIKFLYNYLLFLIILISISSIAYRGVANLKYLPVLLGRETKNSFLSKNLNFSFGDFYDTDEYFKNNIKKSDKVLLYGFHNLYYVNFPFVDSSWVREGDKFNYIAVQNSNIPGRFGDWNLIYFNPKTKVQLFKKGDIWWSY